MSSLLNIDDEWANFLSKKGTDDCSDNDKMPEPSDSETEFEIELGAVKSKSLENPSFTNPDTLLGNGAAWPISLVYCVKLVASKLLLNPLTSKFELATAACPTEFK